MPLVTKYQYVTRQGRNCDRCASWSGAIADLEDDLPRTPNPDCRHPNFCHCTIQEISVDVPGGDVGPVGIDPFLITPGGGGPVTPVGPGDPVGIVTIGPIIINPPPGDDDGDITIDDPGGLG